MENLGESTAGCSIAGRKYRRTGGDEGVPSQDEALEIQDWCAGVSGAAYGVGVCCMEGDFVERILKLSDAYIEKTDEPMLDLTVKMININLVTNHPILQKSRSMYEYAAFIQKVKDYKKSDEPLTNAIESAIHDCLQKGIMTEFLGKHGSEVVNMLFTEFNMEEALKVRGEEQYEIGRAEGKASEIRIIRKNSKKICRSLRLLRY